MSEQNNSLYFVVPQRTSVRKRYFISKLVFFSIFFLPIPSSVNSHSRPKVFPFPDFFFGEADFLSPLFFFGEYLLVKHRWDYLFRADEQLDKARKKGIPTYNSNAGELVERKINFSSGVPGLARACWLGLFVCIFQVAESFHSDWKPSKFTIVIVQSDQMPTENGVGIYSG